MWLFLSVWEMELGERLKVDPSFHDNLYLLPISFVYFLHSTTEVFGHLGNASLTGIYTHILVCIYSYLSVYVLFKDLQPFSHLGPCKKQEPQHARGTKIRMWLHKSIFNPPLITRASGALTLRQCLAAESSSKWKGSSSTWWCRTVQDSVKWRL